MEITMIFSVSILGILFWTLDIMVAEYVFIALILVEKYFKVYVLVKSGLMNIDGAYLEYKYFSPPNNKQSGVEIISEKKAFF
jgi:hypothetical protein